MLCYALSSTFHHLFGKWSFLKIFLYGVLSILICLVVLFAKSCRCLINQAHSAFLVLTTTTVYSAFFDKAVNGKPDAYSLVSCASFAIMSLGLSKQTHFGFEVDFLYFFCESLMLQLMKIKLLLVVVGAGFSYSLIILRSSLDSVAETVHLVQFQDQHFVVLQVDSDLGETNSGSAPLVQENGDLGLQDCTVTPVDSHSEQGNNDSDLSILEIGSELLVEVNRRLNSFFLNHLNKYFVSTDVYKMQNQIPVHPHEVPSEIMSGLVKATKIMVEAGFETECRNLYSVVLSKFLNKCLCKLGLQEVNLWEVEKEKIESLIDAFNVVLKILFPTERGLWDHIFFGFNSAKCNIFYESDWSYVVRVIQLLKSNLEAKSKSYTIPLHYLFTVNNVRYIQMMEKDNLQFMIRIYNFFRGRKRMSLEQKKKPRPPKLPQLETKRKR